MASIPVVQLNIGAPLAQAKEPDPSFITAANSPSLFLAHNGSSFVSLVNTRSNTHHLTWRIYEIPKQRDYVVAIYTSSNPEDHHWHYESSTSHVVLKQNRDDSASFKDNPKNWFKLIQTPNNKYFSLEIYNQSHHFVQYIPDELDRSHDPHQDYLNVVHDNHTLFREVFEGVTTSLSNSKTTGLISKL